MSVNLPTLALAIVFVLVAWLAGRWQRSMARDDRVSRHWLDARARGNEHHHP